MLSANVIDLIGGILAFIPLQRFVADVSNKVDYQFIDELFHYRQYRRYLIGDWGHWDPKITTPPGLYVLTWIYAQLPWVEGGLKDARFFNLLGGCFIGLCCVLIRFNSKTPGFSTASIMLNPLMAIYYSLYYTDVWSAALVVLMYTVVIIKPMGNIKLTATLASVVGLFSLVMRQTNIVWCMFALALLIDQQVKEGEDEFKYEGYVEDFTVFIKTALRNIPAVMPFIMVAGVFVSFVVENGGVALGDKENHILVPHMAQLCYCVTFIMMFTVPLWVSLKFLRGYLVENFGNMQMILFNAFWIPVIVIAVHNFTIIHPFILADNRHYTFYIVRRFIIRDENSKYQLIPVYHFSFYVIYKMFTMSCGKYRTSSLVMFVSWVVCTAMTVIPSPLFEPRYYILPFLMLRLSVGPSTDLVHGFNVVKLRYLAEVIWGFLWTQALYMIFLNVEFHWEDLTDPQRIIW